MKEEKIRANVEKVTGQLTEIIWVAISSDIVSWESLRDPDKYTDKDVKEIIKVAKDNIPYLEKPPKKKTPPREREIQKREPQKELEWQTRNALAISLIEATVKSWRLSIGVPQLGNWQAAKEWMNVNKKRKDAIVKTARLLNHICGWDNEEAAKYLLLDELPAYSPITFVIELSNLRLTHPGRITLVIDPQVDPEDVVEAYRKACQEISNRYYLYRAKKRKHNLELVRFVLKTMKEKKVKEKDLDWQKIYEQWLKVYPDKTGKGSVRVMKATYKRVSETLLQGEKIEPVWLQMMLQQISYAGHQYNVTVDDEELKDLELPVITIDQNGEIRISDGRKSQK